MSYFKNDISERDPEIPNSLPSITGRISAFTLSLMGPVATTEATMEVTGVRMEYPLKLTTTPWNGYVLIVIRDPEIKKKYRDTK